MTVSQFRDEFWQRKPGLLCRERPEYYERMFGLPEVEALLEFGRPQSPSIRMTSSSRPGDEPVPVLPDGRLNMDDVRRAFAAGNTIILNSVDHFCPSVSEVVRALQVDMSFRVQANAYLTPPSEQGFHPHYDTHDVLVAQIEGEKDWSIYGEEAACPLNELVDGDPFRREEARPEWAITLRPGDLLYVPRGWVHEARTRGTHSLHLTLGVHVVTGRDLVVSAVEDLSRRHPEFRASLPMGFLNEPLPRDSVDATLTALLEILRAGASSTRALDSIEDGFLRLGRTAGDGRMFETLLAFDSITVESVVERVPGLHARIVEAAEDVGVQFSQSLVQGPGRFDAAMRFVIRANEPFRVADLPGVEAADQIGLTRNLLRDGLLRRVVGDSSVPAAS